MAITKQEFSEILSQLGLSQIEAARLLSVTARTINRWSDNPHEISGPAEQALRAWLRFKYYKLPWRPDGLPLAEDDPNLSEQIALLRNETIALDQIIQRVKERGGATLPWQVDLEKGIAKLETIEVSFYKLYNDGFSLASYRRTDQALDIVRDQHLLEEAIFSIYQAISKKFKSR